MPRGVGFLAAGTCGLPAVGGGEARLAEGSLAGVCGCLGGGGEGHVAGPGAVHALGVCGPLGGEWGRRGRGCGAGVACGVSVHVSACSSALVWSVVGQGGLEEGLAVFSGHGEGFADTIAYLVDLLAMVGRGYFRCGLRPMRLRTL